MSKLKNKVINFSSLEGLTQKGIYKIYHILKPNLFYIGSAFRNGQIKKCTKGFYRRFLEHLTALEKNKHSSKYLQNVVNKHGIEGIRFEIIEIINSKDHSYVLEREQYYIDTLKPAYNMSKLARCCVIPYTPERLKECSNRMKGKSFPEEVYENIRQPIYQFDKCGQLIQSYISIQKAANTTSIDRASISKAASGKRETAGGFKWSFEKITTPVKIKRLIYQYTLNGIFLKSYNSLEEIKKEFNITSSTSIRNCIQGIQKQAYGYIWKDIINNY